MRKSINKAQGLLKKLKHEFRYRSKSIDEVVMNKTNNPTPKSELFPYKFYDETNGLFYMEENVFGFVLEADPKVGVDKSFYKQLSLLFDDQLPFGGVLEFLLLASDDLSPIIDKWRNARVKNDGIYKKLANYRKDFYDSYNLRKDINIKHRNYRLYISYSHTLNKKYKPEDMLAFRRKLRTILASIGIYGSNVDASGFLRLVRELTNYPNFNNGRYRPLDDLATQLCDVSNALVATDGGVVTGNGEYITKVYEMEDYPDIFAVGGIPGLLGDTSSDTLQIPSRFAIVYSVSNEITGPQQEALKKKGEMVIKQASGMLGKFNRILEEEGKEWGEIISNNLKKREGFIKRTMMVMVTARTAEVENVEQNLMALWKKNDFVVKPLQFFHLQGLLGFCPFLNKSSLGTKLYKYFDLKKTVMTSEPKALLPVHGEWKGTDKGGMILTGKRGQLFLWNNFEGATNNNACFIGESGSGKSVILQELVETHLAQGVRVFVVDIGRSFKNFCNIRGGDYATFGNSSRVSLNPFTNIPELGEYKPEAREDEVQPDITQDSLNYLNKIIAKMAAPIYGTTDIQNAIIAKTIQEVWLQHKGEASIDRLITALEAKGEREKDLALMLFKFGTQGSYGKFFNKPANISFDNQLTVLEFDELRENPELGGVIMQMLAIQIVQQVYLGDRTEKFLVLFDEAWYALRNFPLFLESMAKTVRKYSGALVLATQSLEDFYGSDGKDAVTAAMDTARRGVMTNTAWRVLLKQTAESANSLIKMKMPEHLISVVNSLTTVKGHYSEALIYRSENEYFVSRLMLDKFSQVLYSSSPEVFSKVNHYVESGMSTEDAVETVMREMR